MDISITDATLAEVRELIELLRGGGCHCSAEAQQEPIAPVGRIVSATEAKEELRQLMECEAEEERKKYSEQPDAPPESTPPDIDSRGFPWDERIHSSSRTLCVDGSWKYRRGITEERKVQVEAEITGKPYDYIEALRQVHSGNGSVPEVLEALGAAIEADALTVPGMQELANAHGLGYAADLKDKPDSVIREFAGAAWRKLNGTAQ